VTVTVIVDSCERLIAELRLGGVGDGAVLALACAPGTGIGMATTEHQWALADHPAGVAAAVELIESALRPRWAWWSSDTAGPIVAAGVHLARCWDIAAVHRLLFGGWRADPAGVWATLHELSVTTIPVMGQLDLLSASGDDGTDLDAPVRPDGHLRPEWVSGGWADGLGHLARWAGLAAAAVEQQRRRVSQLTTDGYALSTARAESAAELLCVELAAGGLPLDVDVAEEIIGGFVGPRQANPLDAAEARRRRDDLVLRHAPVGGDADLRNPAHVKSMLARIGVDVTSTRASRLEPLRYVHPFVDALLTWRKAERMATTYGYSWIDEHVGSDGRLRGAWTGSDGAAGRMTAQAGLHNLPAELRPAVIASAGKVFVRADLGQIEPRVLAAISGDAALGRASASADLYAPVAERLGVERSVAKVAVLAAMYGQTSGTAGEALRGLDAAYPVAMRFLRDADEKGRAGTDLRTFGGRLLRMGSSDDEPLRLIAGRGRFARNAVVQGAAAELFKAWAVTVRARTRPLGAQIVLCLHDELLVHVDQRHGAETAALLDDCLQEAAPRWARGGGVRFVADVSVIECWADAKP
jgi:DNA polymerase I